MAQNNQKLPDFTPSWAVPIINEASQKYNVPGAVLASLIQQESGWNPKAVSPAGAQGIAQFEPATAHGMGIDPFNVNQAILGAAHYLRNSMDAFGGSIPLALASYNAGQGAVRQYGGIPPYAETQNYVRNIMAMSGQSGAQPQQQQQQQGLNMQQAQPGLSIPPTQINNPNGASPMPRMGQPAVGGPNGGQGIPGAGQSQVQPSQSSSQPLNMNRYQGGLQFMTPINPSLQGTAGGLPSTAFNPNAPSRQQQQGQTVPASLASIIAQGQANQPSVTSQQPTATPSAILPYLLGGTA